jgi:uncharacterized membrane-anchored protein YitT (DUF2179 family)
MMPQMGICPNFSKKNNLYTNAMIGLKYILKERNNDEKKIEVLFINLYLFFLQYSCILKKRIDTIRQKYKNIQEVIIYDKDYEKVDYSFALKQETDTKLLIGAGQSTYELGLKFKNNLEKKESLKI